MKEDKEEKKEREGDRNELDPIPCPHVRGFSHGIFFSS